MRVWISSFNFALRKCLSLTHIGYDEMQCVLLSPFVVEAQQRLWNFGRVIRYTNTRELSKARECGLPLPTRRCNHTNRHRCSGYFIASLDEIRNFLSDRRLTFIIIFSLRKRIERQLCHIIWTTVVSRWFDRADSGKQVILHGRLVRRSYPG